MSTRATHTSERRSPRRTRRGSRAFIVEALVLFVFLVITLAIVSQLFFASANQAQKSLELERAITVAANVAERFSANPTSAEISEAGQDGLSVRCAITPQFTTSGTLYEATITVSNEYEDIYTLTTARYVSEVR